MRRKGWPVMLPVIMLVLMLPAGCQEVESSPPVKENTGIPLPEPVFAGDVSVEEALRERRSIRDYDEGALTLIQVGQLLWAAQGVTGSGGTRTAPSAGALYPLEVYAVIGKIEGISPGVYRYRPEAHELVRVLDGDQREALARSALNQTWVGRAAIDIVIAAVYERTTGKYGERGTRYVHMEAGHAAQNIYLQAAALGLGTVTIGAFDDGAVKKVLGLPAGEEPLYIMPVGKTGDGGRQR